MKKPKKILYVGNDNFSHTGYVNTIETLSRLLSSEGFIMYRTSSKKNKLIRLLDMCAAFLKYQGKVDYILIDTFSTISFTYTLVISQLSRLFGKKYIPLLHGGNLPYRLEKSPFFSKVIFKNSYRNVAPSNYLKEAFEKKGYSTLFIPNILDISGSKFKLREEIQPNLLWVRAFKHIYNPLLAVEVLKLLKQEYSEAKLCMIGPVKDDSFDLVKEKVVEYGLEKDVEFTGVLSKGEWYQKSEEYDIFINTTNFDNTPVSIMEAMALGLPIVSTNAGGMPYLIDQGKDGILVEKDNPKMMKEAIQQVLSTDHLSMTKIARDKAHSFTWKNVRIKWFEVLE